MEARVEFNFLTNGHRVWVIERHPTRVLRLPGIAEGDFQPWASWEPVAEGAHDVDPSFELPVGALEALLVAAREHVQAVDATVDALHDARMVRDRLLVLVEGTMSGLAES